MALYKKILVAYDGTQPAERAVETALTIAADQGAEVVALKVIAFSFETIVPSDDAWNTIIADLREKAAEVLADVEPLAKEKGVPLTTEIREGGAEDEIVACATETGADLIVLGIGARTARMGRFLGKGQQKLSVRTLVKEAPCPVMLLN